MASSDFGWLRKLGWILDGWCVWWCTCGFMASFWTTGGIRFDLDDRPERRVPGRRHAVYPKENEYLHEPPVTRSLGAEVLRVDMTVQDSAAEREEIPRGNQRILDHADRMGLPLSRSRGRIVVSGNEFFRAGPDAEGCW